MYEKVRPKRPEKKRSTRLWVCLVLAVLLLVAVIIPITWASWYQQRYYSFISDLSDSTVYAYRHVSLRATWLGRPAVVTATGTYGPYRVLSGVGKGKPAAPPNRDPDVHLDFGDGSTLSFWQIGDEDANPNDSEGLLVHYVNQLGDTFTYTTEKATLNGLHFALFP